MRAAIGVLVWGTQAGAHQRTIIAETVNQAIAALSYREALIYRDWQDAIGDAMLEADPDSVRRYKIVGYERFETILMGQSLWMEGVRLRAAYLRNRSRAPDR